MGLLANFKAFRGIPADRTRDFRPIFRELSVRNEGLPEYNLTKTAVSVPNSLSFIRAPRSLRP